MALITIPLLDVDGIPTEAESALLSDPTGTFGIRRVDNDEVVVADGAVLSLVGETYQYDFDDAEDGVEYEAWFELAYDGDIYRTQHFFGEGGLTRTVSFSAMKAGELIDFTGSEPDLASPAGNFGAKSLDDNTTLLASGAAMSPLDGSRIYIRNVPVSSEDERLKFYVHSIVDDVEYYIPSTTAAVNSVILAIGRYTDSYLIGQRFGVDNVHLWLSSPQDDKEEPTDYIRRAYDFIYRAESMLDDGIKGPFVSGPYEITDDYPAIPDLIQRLATDLAGVLMYEARGVDDVDPITNQAQHRLRYVKRDTMDTIRRIQMGLQLVSGSGSASPTQVPIVGADKVYRPWLRSLDC